ncbi:hypothetical protein BD414DRAFT_258742 [Trametes punicea]|nr:hypothetical protein BD414DRAFT_258742 [Trametes punicea]
MNVARTLSFRSPPILTLICLSSPILLHVILTRLRTVILGPSRAAASHTRLGVRAGAAAATRTWFTVPTLFASCHVNHGHTRTVTLLVLIMERTAAGSGIAAKSAPGGAPGIRTRRSR